MRPRTLKKLKNSFGNISKEFLTNFLWGLENVMEPQNGNYLHPRTQFWILGS